MVMTAQKLLIYNMDTGHRDIPLINTAHSRIILCYIYQIGQGIALMMQAASTSEMLVNFYQTAWHNNPEDSHLHCWNCFKIMEHEQIYK
jgi:hypothetical protein